jgi:Ca-activated chloride channel homolog
MNREPLVRIMLVFLLVAAAAHADKLHSQTSKANKLYASEKYDKALEVYDEALLESPGEPRLQANRGAALHKLGRYDESDEALEKALEMSDKGALADVHYNRGNTLFRQGEQMMQAGGQGALEKFEGALSEYAKSLDIDPAARDAKWNLQIAHAIAQQLRQQQQQQQNQDQQKQDGKDDKQKQDKQSQDKQDQKDRDKEQQDEQNKDTQDQQDQQDQQQQPQPQPQDQQEQMKKEEAARLIQQFADDDKNLNKPEKQAVGVGAKPEKDW